MSSVTIQRPDDWHVHLRDDAALAAVAKFTAERFGRAIVMPNLKPAITTTALAAAYRERILAALAASGTLPSATARGSRASPSAPDVSAGAGLQGAASPAANPEARCSASLSDSAFQPLMTLYLTNATPPAEIDAAKASGFVHGIKLYPAGATTHSDAGVTDIRHVYQTLARMEEVGMPLLVHGETPGADIDVFDRESHFIDAVLGPLVERFTGLKVVFEHVTTARAVDFVRTARPGVAATITPQHLLHNRNALFAGGIRPHFYCLPILKREDDRLALLEAATGGNPRFFLGTDSAPHERSTKETACGCAGMFTAHAAIELYAEAFDQAGRLDRLEGFASHFGADFYGLPRHDVVITLVKESWTPPAAYTFGSGTLVPYRAGEPVTWRIESVGRSASAPIDGEGPARPASASAGGDAERRASAAPAGTAARPT